MKKSLSVLTFNIFASPFFAHNIRKTLLRTRVRLRLCAFVPELEKYNPDIVMLQEMNTYFHFLYLRRLMTRYPYVAYHQHSIGPRGGVVIFSKIPLEKSFYIDYSSLGSFLNKSVTGWITRRGIQIVKCDGYPLYLFNTHTIQNSDHHWTKENRYGKLLQAQLHDLTIVINHYKEKYPVILGGDLNMPKDSPFYQSLLSDTRLHDTFEEYTTSTYHNDLLPTGVKVERMDYLFYDKSFIAVKRQEEVFRDKVLLKNGLTEYLSDHIGLYTEYELSEK